MTPTVVQTASAVIAAVACVIDVRVKRIPNWLTFGGALAGLAYHTVEQGTSGLLWSGAGWTVGTLLFLLPFALGGLGAGDVKLVAALGTWLGPANIVWLSLYTGIAGAILAIVVALACGYLGQALSNVWLLLMHWRMAGLKPLPEMTIDHGRGPKLAYGVAIFAGTMVTLWTR